MNRVGGRIEGRGAEMGEAKPQFVPMTEVIQRSQKLVSYILGHIQLDLKQFSQTTFAIAGTSDPF